jgi:hypothetical protein
MNPDLCTIPRYILSYNKKFWEEVIRLLSLHVIYLKYLNLI